MSVPHNVPLDVFDAKRVGQDIFTDLEHCDEIITLACLRVLYDFIYEPLAANKNSIGVGK